MKRKQIVATVIVVGAFLLAAATALWFFCLREPDNVKQKIALQGDLEMLSAVSEGTVVVDSFTDWDDSLDTEIDSIANRFQQEILKVWGRLEQIDSAKFYQGDEHRDTAWVNEILSTRLKIDNSRWLWVETLPKRKWDSIPGKPAIHLPEYACWLNSISKKYDTQWDTSRRTDAVLTDSTITLYPKQGKPIRYGNYEGEQNEYGDLVDKDGNVTSSQNYVYLGCIPALNMWGVAVSCTEGTAHYSGVDYVDCRTGEKLKYGGTGGSCGPYFSPDGRFVLDFYADFHDNDYGFVLESLQTHKGWTADAEDWKNWLASTQLIRVEWVNDSTVKVELSLEPYNSEESYREYIEALSYRVLHFPSIE